MKAAEARLKEIEREKAAAEEANAFDFDAKEKAYMEATLDGETDKALAIRREIRAAEQALYESRMRESAHQAREQTKTELKLQETIEVAQNKYPVFNAESDVFDPDITAEALELFEGYKARGYEPAAALDRAVQMTAKFYDLDAPAVAPEPQQSGQSKPTKQPKPTKEQVKAKMDMAAKQPPTTNKQSSDEPLRDIFAMKESDFDKISAEDERVLRGDFV
jgi:hypothetical protein